MQKGELMDLIDRQAAIDAPEKLIKDCNPEHFVGQQKFIEFMDNAEIGSFGNWQFANGFNMGLTAAEVEIKKLPSAQPERKKGKWIEHTYEYGRELFDCETECSVCGYKLCGAMPNYCPSCGADMRGENK